MDKKTLIASIIFGLCVWGAVFIGLNALSAQPISWFDWYGPILLHNGDDVADIKTSGSTSLKLDSGSGETIIDDNITISGTFDATGAANFASTITTTGGITSSNVDIDGSLYVDGSATDAVVARFDGTSGQAVDILQVRLYDGTEKFDIDSDGDATFQDDVDLASTLDVDGNATFDANVTLGNAAADTITVNGVVTFADIMRVEKVASDPCPGYASANPSEFEGAIFYNATSGYPCFCDGSTDDLRMDDNSSDCF